PRDRLVRCTAIGNVDRDRALPASIEFKSVKIAGSSGDRRCSEAGAGDALTASGARMGDRNGQLLGAYLVKDRKQRAAIDIGSCPTLLLNRCCRAFCVVGVQPKWRARLVARRRRQRPAGVVPVFLFTFIRLLPPSEILDDLQSERR